MFDSLFEEVSIGSLQLPNRVVMPAMNTRFPTEDGRVSERTPQYYRERAKGGAGLIIFEDTYPCEPHPHRHLLTDDSYIDGLNSVVEAVHEENGHVAVQMNIHRGAEDEHDPLAPSRVTTPGGTEIEAITRDKIDTLIERYVDGALRAKEAGFDGIEIHAASGYLLQEFLSPFTNHRSDAYGGSPEGRTRFPRELIESVRRVVGADFPVWFRIPGHEFLDGGLTPTEVKELAPLLVDAGSDALHVTAGHKWSDKTPLTGFHERGVYADFAAEVRSVVDVPVITVGNINDVETANDIIESGRADAVAMARAHLADPHFVRKARRGQPERIRPCVGGLEGCIDNLNGSPVTCTVNAMVGRESDLAAEEIADPKTVVVVGGGPAGLETARVAALRGHSVTLYEKEERVGGQLGWAQHTPGKREYDRLLAFFRSELANLGVDVHCGREIGHDDIRSFEADEVVLATGSVPKIPRIDGLSAAIAANDVSTARDVLLSDGFEWESPVVFGASEIACDTAEYIAEAGIDCTIITDESTMLPNRVTDTGGTSYRKITLSRLEDDDRIEMRTDARVSNVSGDHLTVRQDDEEFTVAYDHIVLAPERQSRRISNVDEIVSDPIVVGDAEAVRGLYTAIHEGTKAGQSI